MPRERSACYVEDDEIGFDEIIKSFLNFVLSAALSTISELFGMEVKHDLCKAEAMTMSIAVSNLWTSLPFLLY